ncbi:MAG: cupredoxin family copper-binding protein, partial [Candidatus Bipolaricaulia bacterium]
RGMADRGWSNDARTPRNGPTPSAPSSSPTEATTVQMADFAFAPQTIRVQAGETVTWVNRDSVGHNVVFDATGQAGRMLGQGQQWSTTFDEPGTYIYYCGPHPFMTGTVVVE